MVTFKIDGLKLTIDCAGDFKAYNILESMLNLEARPVGRQFFKKYDREIFFKGTVGYTFIGHLPRIIDWLQNNKIPFQIAGLDETVPYDAYQTSMKVFPQLQGTSDISLRKIIDSWNLSITPRDYQIDAAKKIINCGRCVSQIATRAGKTLIAYIVFRYLLEHTVAKKILMIVPSVLLMKQAKEDFATYGDSFRVTVLGAGNKEIPNDAQVVVATYQTMTKIVETPECPVFDAVLIDECHNASNASIQRILESDAAKFARSTFGFTGTFPGEMTIARNQCCKYLGTIINVIQSDELIDDGYLRPYEYTQITVPDKVSETDRLNIYNKVLFGTKEQLYSKDILELQDRVSVDTTKVFNVEKLLSQVNPAHYATIVEQIEKRTGNGIVFANTIQYLKKLKSDLSKQFPGSTVLLLYGSTPAKEREEILTTINSADSTNVILVASYKCVGTGLTFKNIDYAISAESFKSAVINGQALGRGLGKYDKQTPFVYYDIIDRFKTGMIVRQGYAKKKKYMK